jgi:hypothetical protein
MTAAVALDALGWVVAGCCLLLFWVVHTSALYAAVTRPADQGQPAQG